METLKQRIEAWQATFNAREHAAMQSRILRTENGETEIDSIAIDALEKKLKLHDKRFFLFRWFDSVFTPIETQRELLFYHTMTTLRRGIAEMLDEEGSTNGENDMMGYGELSLAMDRLLAPEMLKHTKKAGMDGELRDNRAFIEKFNEDIKDFKTVLKNQTRQIDEILGAALTEFRVRDREKLEGYLPRINEVALETFDFYNDKYIVMLNTAPDTPRSNDKTADKKIVERVLEKFASIYRSFQKKLNTAHDYLTNPERAIVLSNHQATVENEIMDLDADFKEDFREFETFIRKATDRLRAVYGDDKADEADKLEAKDEVLGELHQRFRALAKRCHPDKNKHSKEANEAMQKLRERYTELEAFFEEDKFVESNGNIVGSIMDLVAKMGSLLQEIDDMFGRMADNLESKVTVLRNMNIVQYGPEETIEPEVIDERCYWNSPEGSGKNFQDEGFHKLRRKVLEPLGKEFKREKEGLKQYSRDLAEQREQHKSDLAEQREQYERERAEQQEQYERERAEQQEFMREQREYMEYLRSQMPKSENASNDSNTTNNTTNSNEEHGGYRPSHF